MAEMDDMHKEVNGLMRAMLSLAALAALRTRQRDQAEAEARVLAKTALEREGRELAERQRRLEKAQDTRGIELGRLITRSNGVSLDKGRGQERERGVDAISVEQDGPTLDRAMERGRVAPAYDSAESRAAYAKELTEMGLAPELVELRMVAEMAQAKPVIEAVRRPVGPAAPSVSREQDPRGRARDLTRDMTRQRGH
jgi:hypothetical protein